MNQLEHKYKLNLFKLDEKEFLMSMSSLVNILQSVVDQTKEVLKAYIEIRSVRENTKSPEAAAFESGESNLGTNLKSEPLATSNELEPNQFDSPQVNGFLASQLDIERLNEKSEVEKSVNQVDTLNLHEEYSVKKYNRAPLLREVKQMFNRLSQAIEKINFVRNRLLVIMKMGQFNKNQFIRAFKEAQNTLNKLKSIGLG